ncbi:patatin-like phospholipase family protein [Palleronia sp. LCG004]|uniref:patatin-like phospholipase family protein n=1 Tax=Palleronia sp. LCG004 TaxID=3079304 RepID=UPI0029421BF4|nr:patatin-like phospholipase family protein [Palleronia sp. LCG004]WOI56368.1 patatin-like phospholipase family protein [Palleronia sp. LCG004]
MPRFASAAEWVSPCVSSAAEASGRAEPIGAAVAMVGKQTFFDQVVFSGGGTRCFWQAGFIHVLRQEIPVHPERLTGVSGGACSACGFVTHRGERVRDAMIEAFSRQDWNISLDDPASGDHGHTPHQRVYREVIESCFGDREAASLIDEGPQVQILIARPPSHSWAKLSGAAMTLVYEADTMLRSNPHLTWPEAAGMVGELIDANQAARDGRITDLICAAATIPPVFEPPLWGGAPAVDAGMIDQAPLPVPDQGRTLVLLTKIFRDVPEHPDRLYVMPSESVVADKIDFTDPDKLRQTWQQGEEDAHAFLKSGGLTERLKP